MRAGNTWQILVVVRRKQRRQKQSGKLDGAALHKLYSDAENDVGRMIVLYSKLSQELCDLRLQLNRIKIILEVEKKS